MSLSVRDPLSITTFENFAAAKKIEERLSLLALADRVRIITRSSKNALPWLKLARFGDLRTEKNSLRHDANILEITGIEADYDGQKASVAEAVERLEKEGILALVYTSPSHTDDTPRWRVLCPTSIPLPPDRRDKLMGRLNGLFRGIFSGESWTLSQAYYFGSVNRNPSHEVHLIDGTPIDEHDDLDEIWQGKPDTLPATPGLNGHSQVRLIDEVALLSEITSGASYHMASVRLLGRWARIGIPFMDARNRMIAAFEAVPQIEKEGRWKARYEDIDRCLEDIYGAEATQRDAGRRRPPFSEEPPPEPDDPNYWKSVDQDAPPITLADLVHPEPSSTTPDLGQVFDPWNTLQPVAFPMDVIPKELRTFIMNRSEAVGADAGAIAWAAICACSSAIHGESRLHMKRHDPWAVAPALWVALIGAPSTKKSPIIDLAWRPLVRIQATELGAHQRAHDQWRALPKKERDQTPEPYPRRRLVSNDGTMEALQDILARQSRGIGVVRDELAGWIGSMDKYAPGKGSAADRAFWLQSFNGGSHVVDRVMRGTLSIDNLLTAICGGIQPDRLAQFKDLTDDGLFQRFIPYIVAGGTIGGDQPRDVSVDAFDTLVHRLLAENAATLTLSDGAHEIRELIQHRLHMLEQAEVLGGRFTGFVGKLVGIWGRLCLVMHMVDDRSTSVVSSETAAAARTLLFRSIIPNAARVYTAMGGAGGEMEATQSIAGYILTKRLDRIVMSDLTRNVRICRGRATSDVQKLVSPLEAGGWLKPEREFNPTSWLVAEQVHVFFAERAAKEISRRSLVRSLITGEDEP